MKASNSVSIVRRTLQELRGSASRAGSVRRSHSRGGMKLRTALALQAHKPKVAGLNPAHASIDDDGLADGAPLAPFVYSGITQESDHIANPSVVVSTHRIR